jgi:hypothetical protein
MGELKESPNNHVPSPPRTGQATIVEPHALPQPRIARAERTICPVVGPTGQVVCLPVLVSPSGGRAYYLAQPLVQEKAQISIIMALTLVPTVSAKPGEVLLQADGGRVAIKVTSKAVLLGSGLDLIESPYDEMSALQILAGPTGAGHPNLVAALECLEDADFLYMVMPYLGEPVGLDLFTALERKGAGMAEADVQQFAVQVSTCQHCVSSCHSGVSALSVS